MIFANTELFSRILCHGFETLDEISVTLKRETGRIERMAAGKPLVRSVPSPKWRMASERHVRQTARWLAARSKMEIAFSEECYPAT